MDTGNTLDVIKMDKNKLISTSRNIVSYKITNIGVVLNNYATIIVNLYDDLGSFVTNKVFIMDGELYKTWGSDDCVITNFIESSIQNLTEL